MPLRTTAALAVSLAFVSSASLPATPGPPVSAGGIAWTLPARWAKQFEGAPKPASRTTQVAGLRVTRAEVAGTYLAPGGPMMQSTGKKTGYRLLGAIVEAPGGNVFFKLTGPAATIAAAQADFDALVGSIRKK
jgi:hypothetical protein